VTFRQPGCLSKTRGLSAPFLRMVKYYRLSRKNLSLFISSMRTCQFFSIIQLRGRWIRAKEGAARKKTSKAMNTQVGKKAKNLVDVLSEGGKNPGFTYIRTSRISQNMWRCRCATILVMKKAIPFSDMAFLKFGSPTRTELGTGRKRYPFNPADSKLSTFLY
jgi:hypothetical protein